MRSGSTELWCQWYRHTLGAPPDRARPTLSRLGPSGGLRGLLRVTLKITIITNGANTPRERPYGAPAAGSGTAGAPRPRQRTRRRRRRRWESPLSAWPPREHANGPSRASQPVRATSAGAWRHLYKRRRPPSAGAERRQRATGGQRPRHGAGSCGAHDPDDETHQSFAKGPAPRGSTSVRQSLQLKVQR